MSVVEDTRKVIQDFLAPELKEIAVRLDAQEALNIERFKEVNRRLDALEIAVDRRFEEVEHRFKEMDRRFDRAEERANERFELIMTKLTVISDVTEIKFRVAALESRQKSN